MNKRYLDWNDIDAAVEGLVPTAEKFCPDCIVAPIRGGLIAGTMLSHALDVPLFPCIITGTCAWVPSGYIGRGTKVFVVDDIYDTGKTYEKVDLQMLRHGAVCLWGFLAWKDFGKGLPSNAQAALTIDCTFQGGELSWVVFPWEEVVKTQENAIT